MYQPGAEMRGSVFPYVLSPELVMPKVELEDRRTLDGLVIEKLSWRLPFGPKTEAYFLKPQVCQGGSCCTCTS
jgi:hypothetical protein